MSKARLKIVHKKVIISEVSVLQKDYRHVKPIDFEEFLFSKSKRLGQLVLNSGNGT